MASYKQLAKSNWRATLSLGYDSYGKRIKKQKQGFKTKKDAERWVTDTLDKKHKGFIISNESNILFKDFIDKWFYEYKIHTISTNTIANYISRLNTHIIPKLGHYKLNEITNMTVQNFYNQLINQGQKSSSAKKILETLSNCLRYAYKNKLIYTIPTDIQKISIEKTRIEFWDKKHVDFFLKKIKGSYLYTPILLELMTGLRIGELCGLRWYDIDFRNNFISIKNQIIIDKNNRELIFTQKLKTNTSYRKISIPKTLTDYLLSIKNNASNNDFVILNRNGEICNPRNLSMNFKKEIKKYETNLSIEESINDSNYMKLPQITFHGLRHTHATILIANNENIKVVSERLGHTNVNETLNTYTHVMEDMKNNTGELLSNIFNFNE